LNYKEYGYGVGSTAGKYLRNELLKIQEYKCAICDEKFKTKRTTNMDHNHKTNDIRGLLCNNCNSILGFSKENIEILQKSIKYLNKQYNHNEKIKNLIGSKRNIYKINLWLKQENSCAICEIKYQELDKTIHLDHNHEDGIIRGMLCQYCNWILGHCNDNIKILNESIKYLENNGLKNIIKIIEPNIKLIKEKTFKDKFIKIGQKLKWRKKKPFSEETKRRMSESSKGKKKNPTSEETKLKISKSTKGKNKKPFSDDHKKHLSESNKGKRLGTRKPMSIEAKINMKKGQKRRRDIEKMENLNENRNYNGTI